MQAVDQKFYFGNAVFYIIFSWMELAIFVLGSTSSEIIIVCGEWKAFRLPKSRT